MTGVSDKNQFFDQTSLLLKNTIKARSWHKRVCAPHVYTTFSIVKLQ